MFATAVEEGKVFNRNHVIMQMVMSNLKQYISIIASQVIIKGRDIFGTSVRKLARGNSSLEENFFHTLEIPLSPLNCFKLLEEYKQLKN
jgi:hypothetical protein